MATHAPFDKRSIFFKDYFLKGLSYQEFVDSGSNSEKQRWSAIAESLLVNSEQSALLNTFKREMNILVLAGLWCGDCSRQCPMIQAIADSTKCMNVRFLDNEKFPELRDELRISGGSRVPVLVVLSEDFFEISRFGDRHLTQYRRKIATELGDACDIGLPPKDNSSLLDELGEWLNYFERLQLMLRLSPFLRKRHND